MDTPKVEKVAKKVEKAAEKINIEELLHDVKNALNEDVDITIPRKNALMLFGAIIAANVATVFVLQGITVYSKRLVVKKVVTDTEDKD